MALVLMPAYININSKPPTSIVKLIPYVINIIIKRL